MKTPLLLLVCAFGLFGTGCVDHLARYYQAATIPIPGPVATNGTFVTYSEGMTIYHGLPPVPYYILGRFDRPIKIDRLPGAARYYGADFIFIDEHNTDVIVNDPGLMFFNQNVAISAPGNSHVESRLSGCAYLATTNATKRTK